MRVDSFSARYNCRMDPKLEGKLIVAISSRALFNLDAAHEVFETSGLDDYRALQIKHEDELLEKGTGFPLVEGLLSINKRVGQELVEVVLVSRNDADTGLRVMNSVEKYDLPISRAVFTDGRAPYGYLTPLSCHLFLSANPEDVSQALNNGFAAGLVYKPPFPETNTTNDEVRIAFDGDAVLFAPEHEEIYRKQGLEEFHKQERESADVPMKPGPFKAFVEAIHGIQKRFDRDQCPIRTALVTARSAPAHKRAIKTLRSWDVLINESFFMGGVGKDGVLSVFRPHIFFDDQTNYCQAAAPKLPTAQVRAQEEIQKTSLPVSAPVGEMLANERSRKSSSNGKSRSKRSANRSAGRPPRRKRASR